MKKCRIGVIGIGRGGMMWKYCRDAENAELVAICDKWEEGLERVKRELDTDKISYYTDYDEFLKQDMDVVMLANYANEHAPFAIKAMEAGKNVISEVLPCQSMAEAVALIECVERTGKSYCYAENYCFMSAPHEMREKYRAGLLGEFEYGEGEYLHNCEPIWTDITYGDKTHWRNNKSAFFYCTHSAGPIIHITGMRPTSVVGFEAPFNARMARMGARGGFGAVEMVTLENGAFFKSAHGNFSKNSIWYAVYGSKGRMESAREAAGQGDVSRVYQLLDSADGANDAKGETYIPTNELSEKAKAHGHGGSDFYCLYNAIEHIMGRDGEYIDVYEAIDMWMCGFFALLSALNGGAPMDIPDMRDPKVRKLWENDNRCTDPKLAGDSLLPSYTKGELDIPDEVYDRRRREWEKKQAER